MNVLVIDEKFKIDKNVSLLNVDTVDVMVPLFVVSLLDVLIMQDTENCTFKYLKNRRYPEFCDIYDCSDLNNHLNMY